MKRIFLSVVYIGFLASICLGQKTNIKNKSILLNESFENSVFPPSGWNIQNNISDTMLQWRLSSNAHYGNKSAIIDSGQSNLFRNECLITPGINLTSLTNPCLKFWFKTSCFWAVSPNNTFDFRVKISIDGGTNWQVIWKEDSLGIFDDWLYSQVFINLNNYASDTNVKIAFQYQGLGNGPLYIDDIAIESMVLNNLTTNRLTLHEAYTKIPSGLGRPMYYDADISNFGLQAQTHVKIHAVNLSANTESASSDTTILSGKNVKKLKTENYFFTPPLVLGIYSVTSYLSSDSIPYEANDSFNIKVVCDTCLYSRDNNTYTGSVWNGSSFSGKGYSYSNPYTAAVLYQVNQDRMVYGINCVVSSDTKLYSKIKAVLYKFSSNGQKIIVNQSSNYYIIASEIPPSKFLVNPPSIKLCFNTGYLMQKDSIYYAGIVVYGGSDTVKIATDNTGIPLEEEAVKYFDPRYNEWSFWEHGNAAALMIRLYFNPNVYLYCYQGINESDISSNDLLICIPNPATTLITLNYTMLNTGGLLQIYNIMGQMVYNVSLNKKSTQSIIDLSSFTKGMYLVKLSNEKNIMISKFVKD
ncbi:MAG: T9SS type A sorting domain-containing protein [Bacteroidetes bacterium]|nr:T9SS type A sorting domain-containing protein [Bacteroidota bacterium]